MTNPMARPGLHHFFAWENIHLSLTCHLDDETTEASADIGETDATEMFSVQLRERRTAYWFLSDTR